MVEQWNDDPWEDDSTHSFKSPPPFVGYRKQYELSKTTTTSSRKKVTSVSDVQGKKKTTTTKKKTTKSEMNGNTTGSCSSSSSSIGTTSVLRQRSPLRTRQTPMSNHRMINESRKENQVPALSRSRALDELALTHVRTMASQGELLEISPTMLLENNDANANANGNGNGNGRTLTEHERCQLVVNVAEGESIEKIHKMMMDTQSHRDKILCIRYTQVGMASKAGDDGKVYLCQLFTI